MWCNMTLLPRSCLQSVKGKDEKMSPVAILLYACNGTRIRGKRYSVLKATMAARGVITWKKKIRDTQLDNCEWSLINYREA